MASSPSRRTLLIAGLAALTAGVAGCTRAIKAIATTAATSPAVRSSTQQSPPAAVPSTTVPSTTVPSVTLPSTTRSAAPTSAPAHPRSTAHPVVTRASDGPAVEVMSGPASKRQVALTFHGAGDLGLARSILAIARAKKARITVMAVGTWLEQNPDMATAILSAGHELGNHTYSHLDINSLPVDEIDSEIVKCRDLLAKLTGSPGSYFRQSQSQHASDQVRSLAGQAGYRVCLSYNLDSLDYTDPGGAAVRANLQAATNGSIVSMHLGHQSTVDALPGVLDDLRARGLEPVTVGALLAI